MSKHHSNVGYKNLNEEQPSSPIIKKKQVALNLEKENLVPDLLLGETNYKTKSYRKAACIGVSLILVAISLTCGVIYSFRSSDKVYNRCSNKYSTSEIASILQLGQNVDIAFMVEATTKNKENIKSLNKNIQTLVDGVKSEFPNVIVRVAIVAYRDYSDKGKHLKVYELTSNISQVKTFLSNLKPSDKGSKTEDVVGAIEETLNLDWKSPNKHLFQMSVSPPRGFCNGYCPQDAIDFVGPDVTYLIRRMRSECMKYNIIQTDQNQNEMIKKFENITIAIDDPNIIKVQNMTNREFNFSVITSSLISSIDKHLELLNNYFDSSCNHDTVEHDRCLNIL